MNLWIRSQDKYTLMKIEEIQICENTDGTWFMNAGIVLGRYKSKERALEVLDEIENQIASNYVMQTYANQIDTKGREDEVVKLFEKMIYEMPEE